MSNVLAALAILTTLAVTGIAALVLREQRLEHRRLQPIALGDHLYRSQCTLPAHRQDHGMDMVLDHARETPKSSPRPRPRLNQRTEV